MKVIQEKGVVVPRALREHPKALPGQVLWQLNPSAGSGRASGCLLALQEQGGSAAGT